MWYLESLDRELIEYRFKEFDAENIKRALNLYFDIFPKDELWFYKESKNNKKTVGDTLIDIFVNKNGNVCKIVTKGNKEYFKKI